MMGPTDAEKSCRRVRLPPSALTSSLLDVPSAAIRQFAITGELAEVHAHQRGHIHDTFISTWRQADGSERRYLHQRMNDRVFQDIPALMHNIERVTSFLKHSPEQDGLETLELVPTRGGETFLATTQGPWRTYNFIDGSISHDHSENPDQAYRAARAFGGFQRRLLGLDASELVMTIPRFFSSPYRLEQLDEARRANSCGRVAEAAEELSFVEQRRSLVPVIAAALREGRFPSRVVHGDTKLNNVLFDAASGEARCVVDLDTCMPGYSLYDFGDLVRFTAATSDEDERDLDRAGMDLELYEALVQGYLEGTAGFLTCEERELMPLSARLVTLTIGMRFLADHLAGDVYFKISRPGHNLDRARVQFAMVADMEAKDSEMVRAV